MREILQNGAVVLLKLKIALQSTKSNKLRKIEKLKKLFSSYVSFTNHAKQSSFVTKLFRIISHDQVSEITGN